METEAQLENRAAVKNPNMMFFILANVKATHPLPGAIFNEGVMG